MESMAVKEHDGNSLIIYIDARYDYIVLKFVWAIYLSFTLTDL